MPSTNDQQIRSALRQYLAKEHANNPDTLILDELGLQHGAVRVDMVVINHCLHGYELKSDKDTLERLPEQIRNYNLILDRVTLVVGYRHAYQAIKMIPEWWGIMIAEKGSQEIINFITMREPKDNLSLDSLAVSRLLWRDEAISLLDEVASADGFRSKSRETIYSKLVQTTNIETLRSKVRKQLVSRVDWRVGEPQMSYGE